MNINWQVWSPWNWLVSLPVAGPFWCWTGWRGCWSKRHNHSGIHCQGTKVKSVLVWRNLNLLGAFLIIWCISPRHGCWQRASNDAVVITKLVCWWKCYDFSILWNFVLLLFLLFLCFEELNKLTGDLAGFLFLFFRTFFVLFLETVPLPVVYRYCYYYHYCYCSWV